MLRVEQAAQLIHDAGLRPVEDFGPDVLYVPNRCILVITSYSIHYTKLYERILMWETYAEGFPLRKDFPLRGRFSRSEQVRQALNANPEAHYSLQELSLAGAQHDLPPDMRNNFV